MRNMIDSHLHGLMMQNKGVDPRVEIGAARNRGFGEAIDIGVHPSDLDRRRRLWEGFDGVYYTSGFSPAEAAGDNWVNELETLRLQAGSGVIVAIGELGLDRHWNYGPKEAQKELMRAQMGIAAELGLPIVIHNRDADQEVLQLLKRVSVPASGVMHCFSSDYAMATACIDLGYKVSFSGNVTYKKSEAIQEAARRIPLDSILIETDAPYLSPQAVRGRPNSPLHIPYVYELVARLRGIAVEELAEAVRNNLQSIFNLCPLQ